MIPNGYINRTLHNQDEADDYATMVGNVALWGGAVHNCLTLEIPDASSISFPLIPYRRLANAPVLEFWGRGADQRGTRRSHADNGYKFGHCTRVRALFNTTPAMLLFGATAEMVQWRTADQVTDEDYTNLEVIPGRPLLRPQPGRVEPQHLLWRGLQVAWLTSLRLFKVVTGTDNVLLLRAFP